MALADACWRRPPQDPEAYAVEQRGQLRPGRHGSPSQVGGFPITMTAAKGYPDRAGEDGHQAHIGPNPAERMSLSI